jgi:hypothetical protein
MRQWVEQELPKTDRPKTLVVWGPSRTGKTSWARSLGRHSYLGYAWSVKQVHEDNDYIVIDDIDMSNFKLWQPFIGVFGTSLKETYLPYLAGAQKQFTVTDKYTRKITLENWGKPCIWLNNQNPMEIPALPHWQYEYLQANCIFVNLEHRLYQPEEMLAPLFHPKPRPHIDLEAIEEDVPQESGFAHAEVEPMSLGGGEEEDRMEGPSRIPDKGKRKEVVIQAPYLVSYKDPVTGKMCFRMDYD